MPTNGPTKQPLWQAWRDSSSNAKISVLNGMLYAGTTSGLKAVDATGATKWSTTSQLGAIQSGGLSAPAAAGSRLFALSGTTLFGFSPGDGAVASTTQLPQAADQGSNPVTDIIGVVGSLVVCRLVASSSSTGGTDGVICAVETKNDAIVWSVPSTGVPEATMVQGDLVVVAVAATVTAYNAATGKSVWQTPRQGDQDYEVVDTPHGLLATAATRVYHATANSIRSFDAATGRLGWTSAPVAADGSHSSLLAQEGFVYGIVLTSDELRQNVTTGTVFALREADGSVAWSVSDVPCDNIPSNFLLSDGVLYTKDHNSTVLMALDAETGQTLWYWQEPYPVYENLWGAGIVADSDRVYATTQQGISAFSIR
jgi:outer membrane protein assembly factor BamB